MTQVRNAFERDQVVVEQQYLNLVASRTRKLILWNPNRVVL